MAKFTPGTLLGTIRGTCGSVTFKHSPPQPGAKSWRGMVYGCSGREKGLWNKRALGGDWGQNYFGAYQGNAGGAYGHAAVVNPNPWLEKFGSRWWGEQLRLNHMARWKQWRKKFGHWDRDRYARFRAYMIDIGAWNPRRPGGWMENDFASSLNIFSQGDDCACYEIARGLQRLGVSLADCRELYGWGYYSEYRRLSRVTMRDGRVSSSWEWPSASAWRLHCEQQWQMRARAVELVTGEYVGPDGLWGWGWIAQFGTAWAARIDAPGW
ncbi:MAG: hypothetical protein ACE5FI_07345 [Anaerolineales bacterium]